jgi:hypothetical protein
MSFLFLYRDETEFEAIGASALLDAAKTNTSNPLFSTETNQILLRCNVIHSVKLTTNDAETVLNSTRGIPVRSLPALVELGLDDDGKQIPIKVLTKKDIEPDDIDLLLQ